MSTPPAALVTRDEVVRIARLAHLSLSEPEAAELAAQLTAIAQYARRLSDVDTSSPADELEGIPNSPLRADDPGPSTPVNEVLAQAPAHDDGMFAVPGFGAD